MGLRVVPVDGRRGIARFVDVPWHIYDPELHPQWVPPLRAQVTELLDVEKSPFYRNADRALFVALDGRRVLGRIAAIENRAHNDFHADRVGFFGFYESVDDPEVAGALLDRASAWLGSRGLEAMRGPMSPSTNYDCGMLVRGYRWQPSFLTTWNPRYYPALMDLTGMRVVKDLVSYFIPADDERAPLPVRVKRQAERAREQGTINFRDLDLKHFDEEVERVWQVYSGSWDRNWGFVPVTREEFDFMAKDLRHLVVKEFVFLAEAAGRTVGVLLVVPDYNFVLKRIGNGRLFPIGIFKLLLGKRRLKVGRVMLAGILPEYRGSTVLALFFDELKRRAKAYDAVGTDASWVLEDNMQMRGPIEAVGGKVTRRWRIYERPVPTSSHTAPREG